jgi:glycosyltransferase involved in cell wall biosynthesis
MSLNDEMSMLESTPPLVSVIIPTKNSSRTIESCLLSVSKQTYTRVETIVVDNYSSDDTCRIASNLGASVVQWGPERSAQRNRGLSLAKGSFVLFIDADMLLSPTTIEESVRLLESGYDAAVLPLEAIGKGFWAKCKWLERRYYDGATLVEAARFFRTDVVKAIGGFDEQMYAFEDWDIHNRCVSAKFSVTRAARANAVLLHDEGTLKLSDVLKKRGYYGRQIALYSKRYPQLARRQLGAFPRLMLFVRRWDLLLKHPVLAVGLFFLKGCEGLSALILKGSHEAIYEADSSKRRPHQP